MINKHMIIQDVLIRARDAATGQTAIILIVDNVLLDDVLH